jgi:Rrf2 family protein
MLSVTSRYALKALVSLGDPLEREYVLGRDLAEQTQVPGNYLSKILLILRNAGMVEAMRGTHGGYRLGKHPKNIRLIEVVELFEGSKQQNTCLLDSDTDCSSEDPCLAHAGWEHVYQTYLSFLESTTLSDITPGHQRQSSGEFWERNLPFAGGGGESCE